MSPLSKVKMSLFGIGVGRAMHQELLELSYPPEGHPGGNPSVGSTEQVTVSETFDGTVTLLYQSKVLDYTCWIQGEAPPLADDKAINAIVDQGQICKDDGLGNPPLVTLDVARHPYPILNIRRKLLPNVTWVMGTFLV